MTGNQDQPATKDFYTTNKRTDLRRSYEKIKIGFLGAEMGPMWKGYRQIHRMAFDEGYEQGWLTRDVEMIMHAENGLPLGTARNATDGFRWLVDQGCIAVAGAYSSDNAIVVAPVAEELKTPLISWSGTERLLNPWTFRLGNGDCGGDPALIVNWLVKNGLRRVGVIAEVSPNGEEYLRYFRQQCRRYGVQIGGLETVEQTTENLQGHLEALKSAGCQALVHMGYGMLFVHDLFRPALEALDWDPPRITTTAFMFYLVGFDHFDGWTGIDQYCPDNPLVAKFYEAYKARYHEDPPLWPNAIPLLAYDTARVLAEAIHRAPVLNGQGMRDGLERIRFLPSSTGGPRTHIAAAPGDHNMFKGDWLLYSKIKDGKLLYQGLCDMSI